MTHNFPQQQSEELPPQMSDIDEGSSSDSDSSVDSSVDSSMFNKCLRTPANIEDKDPFVSQIQIPRSASAITGSDNFAHVR